MWLEWEDWASCNVTCGGGIQSRNRTCDGPYFGGLECSGTSVDFQTCGENPCPSRCFQEIFCVNKSSCGKVTWENCDIEYTAYLIVHALTYMCMSNER